jgi:hypothetical protein
VRRGLAVLVVGAGRLAAADPIALRADAFATSAAPAGLLSLSADGDAGPGLSAEAAVWIGQTGAQGTRAAAGDTAAADVLVIALHARTATGRAAGTFGRFVATLGALRPLQVDGASGRVALPHRFVVEAYAGVPVQPELAASRTWDWAIGGRAARRIGDWGSVGVAYTEQRIDGQLATEEVGADAGAALGAHADLAGKLAFDLVTPGVAEASITASERHGAVRADVYATYTAASHLLPATSLFTVIGDVPALRAGAMATWRAAPRLDVSADLAVRRADGDGLAAIAPQRALGEQGEVVAPAGVLRATLRLDALGASALGGELRRDGAGDAGWTGARAMLRLALPARLVASLEAELVIPDRDRGLGRAWPWALAGLSRAWGPWRVAIGVEAQASAVDRARIDALAQVGRTWGAR